jgi:hypothetical protein
MLKIIVEDVSENINYRSLISRVVFKCVEFITFDESVDTKYYAKDSD